MHVCKQPLFLIITGIVLILLIAKLSGMGIFNKLFGKEEAGQKESSVKKERLYTHDHLKSEKFERYILVKGANLPSVEAKLKEYGELPERGNTYIYHFSKARLNDWTVIKMPSDYLDYYGFHNMVYWLLGCPSDDTNYADLSIGLSVGSSFSYAIYNNYKLKDALNLEDDLFGVFSNDEKFILSIPFDEFKASENKNIHSFSGLFKENNLNLETIKGGLVFERFDILFNEK